MTYQTPPTAVPGFGLSAANWNAKVRDSMEALGRPPRARVHRAAALNMANATVLAIPFDTEQYDTHAFHDNVTNNSRFTIPRAGVYFVRGSIYYGTAAGGVYRLCGISKNGGSEFYNTNRNGTQVSVECSGEIECVVGDYIEIIGYQDSGAALAIVPGKANTDAHIRWVSL